MKFQTLSASVRSFRFVGVALLIALGCSAPFTRASAAPTSAHIYLYDNIFGITDVTNTYDGASVVSLTGDVVYVAFLTVSANGSTNFGTSAGQHTTDFGTSAGQHTTDFGTSAGQHTTDIIVDDTTGAVVGFVAP